MNSICYTAGLIGSDPAITGDHLHTIDIDFAARLAKELPMEFEVPPTAKDADALRARMQTLLGDVAAIISEKLKSGVGLVILVGAGLAMLTDDQLTAMLYGLSLVLGRPMAQNLRGERLVSIRDERPENVENARGYTTNDRMLPHTDASDIAGFACLRQAAVGGANFFVSAAVVHDVLAREVPELIHEYYRLWSWNVQTLQMPGTPPALRSPIFSLYAGELSCRYGSYMLRSKTADEKSELTVEQVRALDLFEEVIQRPEVVLRYTLRRGESAWINNYRVLHGREAFKDGERIDSIRLMIRVWVWLNDRPVLAPAFASFNYNLLNQD